LPKILYFPIGALLLALLPLAKVRKSFLFVLVGIALLLFYNGFIQSMKLGEFNRFVFAYPRLLNASAHDLSVGLFGFISAFYVTKLLLKRQWTLRFFSGLLVVSLLQFGYAYYRIQASGYASESDGSAVPIAAGMKYSRNGKNIIIIFVDAFPGSLLGQVAKDIPGFSETMSGFVWYPNTLSVGSHTAWSVPAMYGGMRYRVENWPALGRPNIRTLLKNAYDESFEKILAKGFDLAVSDVAHYPHDCAPLRKRGIHCFESERSDVTREAAEELYSMVNPDSWEDQTQKLLFMTSVFKVTPAMFKKYIYDDGTWLIPAPPGTRGRRPINTLTFSRMKMFEMLWQKAEVVEVGNFFKYYHNNVAHPPYYIEANCQITNTYRPADGTLKCMMIEITKYIQWLKEKEVYDNSKIIIVSDHGNYGASASPLKPRHQDIPVLTKMNKNWFSWASALMMVKDFDAKGVMREDHLFLSNGDTMSIACAGVQRGCDGIGPSPIKKPIPNRKLTWLYGVHGTNWGATLDGMKVEVGHWYEVSNSIYDLSSWKRREPPFFNKRVISTPHLSDWNSAESNPQK
jgi:hypothetical protein